MSANVGNASSAKPCCFCNLTEDNELEYGKIYEHDGIVTHYYCLLLSSNMEQKGNDNEGILGFLAEDIQKELRRGKRLVCSYCRKIGATLGCCNVRCKRIFHFPCGLKAGSLHQFFGEFRSYCVSHRPKQKIEDLLLKQIGSVDNALCYICYDKVNTDDFIKTLWAPCCKKDAWFHRICVQQLALSAGYFFKCPLCNNKKDFQKAMQEYGIFVPSQDASWELVPNAFEELLYRHDQCDAAKCLCPKGRKHTSNNAKWELTLCRTCGSQGIHMACGQLKWANPVWECEECISILRNSEENKHARLGSSSVRDGCSQSRDSDPDLDSGSDLDSVLDSDTDISVGTEFPMPYPQPSYSSTSSIESNLDVTLRPGPRSFKLQQQMNRLSNCRLESINTEKNVDNEASPKNTNKSASNNDDEKKEPSTSKENIPQDEKKEINCSNGTNSNKETISSEEGRQSSSNNKKSQLIRKEADVITIESDDDNDVEFITLKRRTDVLPPLQRITQSRSSCIIRISTSDPTTAPPLKAPVESVASKHQVTTNLSKNDNIALPNPTVSEPEALKSESTISDQSAVATPRESTLDSIASSSNDPEETNAIDMSVMNIKITNVTSLPPEVFDNVPDIICENVVLHKSITDTSSSSASNTLEQLVTPVSSTKRSMHEEASGVTDNCKKIKGNNFDKRSQKMSPAVTNVTINVQTESQPSESTPAIKPSETGKNDKNPSKCTHPSTNEISKPPLNNNQQNNSPAQSMQLPQVTNVQLPNKIEPRYVVKAPPNSVSINIQARQRPSNKSSAAHGSMAEHIPIAAKSFKIQAVQQPSNESSVTHRNMAKYVPIANNNQVFVQLPPIGGFYFQPGFTLTQNAAKVEKLNMYAVPSSSVIVPQMADNNITVLSNHQTVRGNHQTVLVNQPLMASNVNNVNTAILNNNQIETLNQPETVTKKNIPAASNLGNSSSNNTYCDGDAGTSPAETDSTGRKEDDPPSESHRSVVGKQIASPLPATRSVFPKVTNNHNTCHQPRLIPRYMNLHDLKFRVCELNKLQMTLYDTFSVNISMKGNPKKGKSRSAASREPKESPILVPRAQDEASCSSDYVDSTLTEEQRPDKFFRTSKNESCLINDQATCAKHVARGREDAKENLDPIRSRMPLRSGASGNMNLSNNVDDTVTASETDSETRLVASDTNLSVLNRTICNANVDNVTDGGVTLVPNQGSRLEQASARGAMPAPAEERSGAPLFCKETNRPVRAADFGLNVVNINKTVEKVSLDDITVPTNRHTDGDRISSDHTDDSPTLRNGYKHSDGTNVMRPRVDNWSVARVSNITRFNEHSILNKQIDTCDSKKFIRCTAFQENAKHRNGEAGVKHNDEFGLKVSVDLCKIQNLIDSKPELFVNREQNANDQWRKRTSRLHGRDDCTRRQVRYCDIVSNDSINHCPSKNRELQKSNYACNLERMQVRDAFPGADTFLRHQKPNQGIKYFDKHILDR